MYDLYFRLDLDPELDNTKLVSEAAPAWPVCAKWLVMMDAKYRPGHKLYFHPRHKASDIKQPGHNLPLSETWLIVFRRREIKVCFDTAGIRRGPII